ncbi:MAG: phosphate ABC transporter substrate-binding protein [Candidatus Kapaibacterium sp.]
MKHLWNLGFALVFSAMVVGCGGGSGEEGADGEKKEGEKTTITQKGSDTMVLLAQKWAEEFGKKHPNIVVVVNGGGSGNGIKDLIDGLTQIANASRPMKEQEIELMKQKYGNEPYRVSVAKDGITVYLNKENPVEQLTIEQLRDIYQGKITNWKEVGGKDGKIKLYGRENSSGTYEFFKDHVLDKGDFAAETQSAPGTALVVDNVKADVNGIGYGGAGYTSGVKTAKLVAEGGEAVEPTEENIFSGKYPLSRDLYMYMQNEPSGAVKEYIDWILSAEGQKYVVEQGYFPMNKAAAANNAEAKDDTAATVK